MNKILFGHHGQFGDIVLGLPALEFIKGRKDDIIIDLAINKKYMDMAPLFYNHYAVNSIVITDSYENFPSPKDNNTILARKYDHIFDPMAPHIIDRWYDLMHQTESVLFDYKIHPNGEYFDKRIYLEKWFDPIDCEKSIALAAFPGFYGGLNNNKALSIIKAQKIVEICKSLGYKIIQIGGQDEPKLEGTFVSKTSYFDSVRTILGCKLLICGDSGINWVMSGYEMKILGLYSNAYYGSKICNIQPINPNAKYLDSDNVNNISLDLIKENLENILKS